MDWQAKYFDLIKRVQNIDNDLGIYPLAVESQNKEKSYKERDGFKNGWNSAVMEYGIKICGLGFDAEEEISADVLILQAADIGSFDKEGSFQINLNDTWYWACADGETVSKEEIPELVRLYKSYGWCGVLYWVYLKRGKEKTAFKDNNRFIEFVEKEEQLIKEVPKTTLRAYKDYEYTLGKTKKSFWKFWTK